MEQQERTTPRIIGALVARDAGCALRNPTVLLCAAVAVGFSWLFGATLADELTATPGFAVFLMAFATILPTLEVGGVVTLFAMSEEDAHGTYDVMVRGGASLEAIVAAKVIVGAAGCAVLVPVCLALAGAPRGCLGPAVLLTAVGSPFSCCSADAACALPTRCARTDGPGPSSLPVCCRCSVRSGRSGRRSSRQALWGFSPAAASRRPRARLTPWAFPSPRSQPTSLRGSSSPCSGCAGA